MEHLKHRGITLPLIGFGTWLLGENKDNENNEIQTFLYGINHYSMTLIDTAEMYGFGKSESVVKKIVEQCDRGKLFIIDKILPSNAKKGRYVESCKQSLKNVGADYFDLYLLHWKENVNLQDMVNNMERLKELGLIKEWGVSNFDVDEMEELFRCKNGNKCFCNQVLYNLGARGPEFDLIPWCKNHDVLFMAYSPLFNERKLRERITRNEKFIEISHNEDMTPESLMLNFVIRNKDIVTVFKTSNVGHLNNNLKNVFKVVSNDSMEILDSLYPKPEQKVPLLKI